MLIFMVQRADLKVICVLARSLWVLSYTLFGLSSAKCFSVFLYDE